MEKLIINMTPQEFKKEGLKYKKIWKNMMSKTNLTEFYTKKEFIKMFEESGYGSPCGMTKREICNYLNIHQVRMKDVGKVEPETVEQQTVEPEPKIKMNIKPPKKPKAKLIYSGDEPKPIDPQRKYYSWRDADGVLQRCSFYPEKKFCYENTS